MSSLYIPELTRFDLCDVFKPNALLANVTKDMVQVVRKLTKQGHIVIVGVSTSKTYSRKVCIYLVERIKVTTKFTTHFAIQSRPRKSGNLT
jgi:D-arabinose 1-dehydrogenase-like Zn-dependent alcohol dehydrogenase